MMTPRRILVRGTELLGRPVVTLGGDDIAQVKDVVFGLTDGLVAGFTLAGRGLLAGPLKQALPWEAVHGLGQHALMVAGASALVPRADVLTRVGTGGDVLGDRVLTEGGTALGTVVDVILQLTSTLDIVGYEIQADETLPSGGRRGLIPLPDTLAISGENLVVPSAATDFLANDLAGFAAAVDAFRAHLRGEESA